MAARSFDDELEQLFDRSLDAVFVAGFDGYLRRVNRGFDLAHMEADELASVPAN